MAKSIARSRLPAIAALHGVTVKEVEKMCRENGISLDNDSIGSGNYRGWKTPVGHYTHQLRG